jgi:hypothetical protein
LACPVLIYFGMISGSSKMGVQEEQERRRDLLQRALKACPDPEQALAVAARMEQFIIDGQTLRERPHEATQPGGQPSSEGPRKTSNRSRWTGDDDARLRRLWQDDLTIEVIARELQRTPASIYGRARQLRLSSSRREAKKGKNNTELLSPDQQSANANSEEIKGFEAVGIDSVVHFLRTRDYSVASGEDGCYKLDGRKVLTAQELFERANKVRAQLGRPTWAALA